MKCGIKIKKHGSLTLVVGIISFFVYLWSVTRMKPTRLTFLVEKIMLSISIKQNLKADFGAVNTIVEVELL
jgi:hypothetical protein